MSYQSDMSGVEKKLEAICKNKMVGSFAASNAARLMERYVPYRDGGLRASAVTEPFRITYKAPYAHRQWEGYGIKHRTTPGTTSHWEKQVNKAELARNITQYIGALNG